MGQLGHPDWDKQVIVRFIIAAAYSPAPATRFERYMAYVLALQSAYGSACKIWAMPTAGPRWAPGIWRRPAPPFFGGGPRGQHGGSDANPVVDVRLEVRAAAKRGTVMQPTAMVQR